MWTASYLNNQVAFCGVTVGAGEVCGCIEMMSGAVWVRDQLADVGWDIRLADAHGQSNRAVGMQDRPCRGTRIRRLGPS
jgi:hypothetical protein